MSELRFELMQSVEQRTMVFELLNAFDLLKVNMHAWEDPQLEDWLAMTKNGDADVWYASGWGIYYLTQAFGITPMAHFAIWPDARRDAEKFLCAAIRHAFTTYSFPAVVGLTPARFRHVFPLIRRCEFEILGTIPGAVQIKGKPADGVLSIYRRR